MIKKLRGRFIRVAMLSVVLVLFVIMGAINILNYRNVVQESDAILTVLAENGGSFPGMGQGGPGMQDGSLPPDGLPDDAGGAADETIETAEGTLGERPELPPDGFDREDREDFSELFPAFGMRGISEETPFESRWFSVTMSADGEASDSDISNIASVDSEKAAEYAAEVYGTGRTKGFKDSYRYLRTDKEDGTATLLFLDCQRSLANFRSFLWISILVSAIGIAAVFVLVVLLSKRVTRPVQESYEKQRQFITDAGHELKTPLTIIDADVSVLEMDLGENEWLDDVKVQTKRLTGLTNDLIYLSRMEEGEKRMQMIDFPISDVIAEEAQSFRARAQVAEKTFQSRITPQLTFCGDEKSIRQLASILLDNALKYSPAGGKIEVSLRKAGKNIAFSVFNTAENVDKSQLPRLFERFYRTDASRNSATGGYGIGLSIAQAIVTAHKGKIYAESPDGRSLRITALF